MRECELIKRPLRHTILGSNLKVYREIKKKRGIKFVTGVFEVNFDWLVN